MSMSMSCRQERGQPPPPTSGGAPGPLRNTTELGVTLACPSPSLVAQARARAAPSGPPLGSTARAKCIMLRSPCATRRSVSDPCAGTGQGVGGFMGTWRRWVQVAAMQREGPMSWCRCKDMGALGVGICGTGAVRATNSQHEHALSWLRLCMRPPLAAEAQPLPGRHCLRRQPQ